MLKYDPISGENDLNVCVARRALAHLVIVFDHANVAHVFAGRITQHSYSVLCTLDLTTITSS